MSEDANTDLIELAKLHSEYWTGTVTARVIDRLIATNDLEQLEVVLKQSAARMFDLELEYQNDA